MSNKPKRRSLTAAASDGQPDPWEPHLADQIFEVYPAVHPGLGFQQQLHDGLMERMRHRVTLRIARPAGRRRWAVIVGAALGSLVSLVGVAAYLVCSRLMGNAQHAASH
jgi:hypothetical protein